MPPLSNCRRSLLDLIAPELRKAFRAKRYSDVLAYIALLKRSVSTVAASSPHSPLSLSDFSTC